MHGSVTDHPPPVSPHPLASLGWSDFFEHQRAPGDAGFVPRRIAEVHRARLTGLSDAGPVRLTIAANTNTGDFAVGDWVLVDPHTETLHRRLQRRTVLERHVENSRVPQLAAANVDTLFIVTSCNADFNPARLERYLALANQGGAASVIVLTKADDTNEADSYRRQAAALQRDLPVLMLDPRARASVATLAPWCGFGQTVAMVGSSGVGKSTLVNTLAGPDQEAPQQTGAIREHDAKGRHTTTARSLHAIAGGGWVIDTPGMRTLHVGDAAEGIGTLFAEITELAPLCRFSDCTHAHEPGCAVQAAVKAGTLDPARLARWRTLFDENKDNTPVLVGPRGNRTFAGRPRRR
ncbi:ribosome small subunit-dependent GTPase A [Lichenifustis flavocetrariae]|uniref:Small ribosomal subunit biogenesis GTPase RsgA n=1 Tax=Lichenifustis flavocetrariae TaxID=2949735 RepID=A0AA41YRT5_9HYPH|nr:ribosome small subunit-dependent GTPase A [Lichenifustis flavocetrariae]MCW6507394.1 ribosome small subunit-dependent GTPase A [Lichenifustis flavocetrariae]